MIKVVAVIAIVVLILIIAYAFLHRSGGGKF